MTGAAKDARILDLRHVDGITYLGEIRRLSQAREQVRGIDVKGIAPALGDDRTLRRPVAPEHIGGTVPQHEPARNVHR